MQLVTWNTQMGCDARGDAHLERMAQKLQSLGDCDVLCLQEVAVNCPDQHGVLQDPVAQLQALLPGWQIFFGAAVDVWVQGRRQQLGNVVATRLQVLNVQHYPLPHPVDPGTCSLPRMATVVTVQDPTLGPVRVMTTHLASDSKRQRLSQANYLRRLHFEALSQYYTLAHDGEDRLPFQAPLQTPYAVLCGDFQFETSAPEYATIGSEAAAIDCLEAGWPEPVVGARWNDAWQLLHPHQEHPAAAPLGSAAKACEFVWVSDDLRHHVREVEVDRHSHLMITCLCA